MWSTPPAPDGPAGAHAVGEVVHSLRFRLSWGECDPAGIIYYATYLEWAERVHTEWWHLAGYSLAELPERLGAAFVVRNVTCDFRQSPKAMDLLDCSMRVARVGISSFTMAFDFVDVETSVSLASMGLTAVFVDAEQRATPVPTSARALLAR